MNAFMIWLAMGGYATYIWPAYAFMFAVFIMHGIAIKIQHKATRKKLKQWLKRQ